LSISQDGATCSDPLGLATADMAKAAQVDRFNLGSIALERVVNGETTSDSGSAWFGLYNRAQIEAARGVTGLPSLGTCTVYPFRGTQFKTADAVRPVLLDAGLWINITRSDNVQRQLPMLGFVYSGPIGGGNLTPFLDPGSFTIDNRPDGPNPRTVLPFSVPLNILQGLTFNITLTSISRSRGLTVTWTGLNPAQQYVHVSGYSIAGGVGATFLCSAPAAAQTFTLPPAVLSALPVGSGELRVGVASLPARLAIPSINLDALYVGYITMNGHNLDYVQ
jgi:hypothetical protein